MSSSDSPIILSSINPAPNALCLSAFSTKAVIVYASGLTIHILDASSLSLLQSIHLIDHLPHLSASQYSIDSLYYSDDQRKLTASCGHLTVIFERSTSNKYSWNLHSTFSSHICKISSVQLKDSYCLVAGPDGLSIHQLQQDSFDSDGPPRWIKRWTLRGQWCDQAVFAMLDDGTCLVATSAVGSSVVELYEFYPADACHGREFSRNSLFFSLPIHSIHLSPQTFPSDPLRWPLSLTVQVANPVLGVCIHFYRLAKQPSPVTPECHNQLQHGNLFKPKVRCVHDSACTISLPPNSPRIVAAFPLDNFNENSVPQNSHLLNSSVTVLLVVLSNGQVNLVTSSRNTSLLSPTPFILPDNILNPIQTQGSTVQVAIAMRRCPADSQHMGCSMIVRPLTSTGEIFVTGIPLDDLWVPPAVSNLQSRLLSVKTIPYGFRPLFTPIKCDSDEQDLYAGVFVTTSLQDEDTKYVCLVDQGSVPQSRLLAYDAVTETDGPVGEIEAAGCFFNNCAYPQSHAVNPTTVLARSTSSLPFHVGHTAVFMSYFDHKIHTCVQSLSLQKIGLRGFKRSERPKTLIMNVSGSIQAHATKGGNLTLCLTSTNRLILWNVPHDFDSFHQRSLKNPTHEISLPSTLFSSTLTINNSSAPSILALDTKNELFRSTLPENYHDVKPESLELKEMYSHPIGAEDTLNLNNLNCQAFLIESHESRFIAMLWLSHDTHQCQKYRIVILDLHQQPYSAGIVGLNDFEILKDDPDTSNPPQLKWSNYQKGSNRLNYCFLAVCCGNRVARFYTRDRDGWWNQTWDLHSKFGSISQICWVTHSNDSILLYQASGHTLASCVIRDPSLIDLPPWHPVVLKNTLLFGNISLVLAIVACLSLALKGVIQPLTLLYEMFSSSHLVEDVAHIKKLEECASGLMIPDGMSPTALSSLHIDVLISAVNKRQVPLLAEKEQLTLLTLSKILLQVQTARSHGIDLHGCQYIFSLSNYLTKSYSGLESDVHLGFDLSQDCGILFAQLSTSQSLLAHETCSVLQNQINSADGSQFKLNWNAAKSVGIFLWLTDQEQINKFMEQVGQVEYVTGGKQMNNKNKNSEINTVQEQDPAACSLFYMALRKKRLLLGLWKVAYGNSDRNLMLKFLQNDFSEERWKIAAQKNAFALISRQRFSFAASFFLLADRLQDAVNVCVQRLSDWQLGIAICRAYEGDHGPILKKLIKEIILPIGFSNANRWLISWCFNMLSEPGLACKVLAVPWQELAMLQTWSLSPVECKAVRVGPLDLSLVLLFNQLKIKYSSFMPWKDEKSLILLVAEELINSGCNSLAGILLRNWNMNPMTKSSVKTKQIGIYFDQPKAQSHQINEREDDVTSDQNPSFIMKNHENNAPDTSQVQSHQDRPHQSSNAVPNRVLNQPIVPEFDMSQFF